MISYDIWFGSIGTGTIIDSGHRKLWVKYYVDFKNDEPNA